MCNSVSRHVLANFNTEYNRDHYLANDLCVKLINEKPIFRCIKLKNSSFAVEFVKHLIPLAS